MSADGEAPSGVTIVAPDDRWPDLFAAERRALEGIAGLREIEHFGSTAVPGLAAKPVIDIMAAVDHAEAMSEVEPALAAQGYQLLDVGFGKRWFLRKPAGASGVAVHLHLISADRWPDKHERLFRDWLIVHPETARRYALLKQELAARFPEDREAYTAGKTEFVREIVNQARGTRGLGPATDWDE